MLCRVTGETFEVTESERAHLVNLAGAHPIALGDLPLPDTCPQEFLRQFTAWGNLLNIFRSKSCLSGTPQLSRYNPDLVPRICTPEEFWSDAVDNCDFGRPYDFSRPFFDQMRELLQQVIFLPLNVTQCEGSEYINGAFGTKNSYLSFGIYNSEECLYCYMVRNCVDCIDCLDAIRCESCYDCHNIRNCHACRSCLLCTSCSDCVLCEDCFGCRNCALSFGLRNQEYCVRNIPVGKKKYEEFLAQQGLQSRTNFEFARRSFRDELKASGFIATTLINEENSSGQFMTNVKDVYSSFYTHTAHDCGHIFLSHDCSDFWRGIAESATLGYQSLSYLHAYGSYNCYTDFGGAYNMYCLFIYNSCQHCFGSVGLKKKSYCILNKEYSKDEYFDLLPRIISHMKYTAECGRFFPPHLAPHYNQQAFCDDWLQPIPIEEVRKRGYREGYYDYHSVVETVDANKIPDDIENFTPLITDRTYKCLVTGKLFKFQPKELAFYRKFGIPPPNLHWAQRIRNRITDVFLIPNDLH